MRWDDSNALDYSCPECGAEPGKRCRKPVSLAWRDAKREQGIPAATQYAHVKPHPERVQAAWRAWREHDEREAA